MFGWTQGLSLLPIFLVSWSSATFIVSYLIAIYRNDVDVIFPYISDTSATPPESCIFGLMTFISASAGTATVYARFKYVEKMNEGTNVVASRVNTAALVLGLISCLGMVVVATFQETAVIVAHDVGALLFFVPGILYVILQVVISFQAYPISSSVVICRARLGFAIIATLAFFPSILPHKSHVFSARKDGDYPFHIASAVCEWIVSFSFIFFFYTYIDEFKVSKGPQGHMTQACLPRGKTCFLHVFLAVF
uniref:DNA-damage regulated autophagy modulator 1 n=1 Tax=Takifugu rubripes TaxID=31033 RepID=A0A674MJV2_TAKRU